MAHYSRHNSEMQFKPLMLTTPSLALFSKSNFISPQNNRQPTNNIAQDLQPVSTKKDKEEEFSDERLKSLLTCKPKQICEQTGFQPLLFSIKLIIALAKKRVVQQYSDISWNPIYHIC